MINVIFVGGAFLVNTQIRRDLRPENEKCQGHMFSAFLSYPLIHSFHKYTRGYAGKRPLDAIISVSLRLSPTGGFKCFALISEAFGKILECHGIRRSHRVHLT